MAKGRKVKARSGSAQDIRRGLHVSHEATKRAARYAFLARLSVHIGRPNESPAGGGRLDSARDSTSKSTKITRTKKVAKEGTEMSAKTKKRTAKKGTTKSAKTKKRTAKKGTTKSAKKKKKTTAKKGARKVPKTKRR